ncbi:MAG: hypothetical protein Q8R78_01575 [Candidatus Omnitrophota bacterium]|nr:hypothetical protein [Candidatus Omnitrophota bacterium]
MTIAIDGKKIATNVALPEPIYRWFEKRAREERRPLAQLMRNDLIDVYEAAHPQAKANGVADKHRSARV